MDFGHFTKLLTKFTINGSGVLIWYCTHKVQPSFAFVCSYDEVIHDRSSGLLKPGSNSYVGAMRKKYHRNSVTGHSH